MAHTQAPSTVTARDPKGLKFISIIEAAYNKAGLSDEEAQRVNETPGLVDLVAGFITKNRTGRFANEEVASNYGYPSGYRVKGVTEHANILRQYFPGVGSADEKLAEQPLPEGAEGYFAIPRWETIAPTYGEAVEKVFAVLAKQRNGRFSNYCKGKLSDQYLRQTEEEEAAFQTLGDAQQGYDILVVPAQSGLRHRGRSVRRAREVMNLNEFGLGAFAVGIVLLTHPERLVDYNNLWIDCAGDEYSPDGDGRFFYAPSFLFYDGTLGFVALWFGRAYDGYGSASGFLPAVAVGA
jgi:hypothetical protein